ncbi:hypothetical protein NPS29_19005 [Pseudomonas putida]|uniref:hypothetical protein n=1 Tax=Pseudomonas putida TaxID=303 RepID=UPI0023646CD1|nr:hypothetical protein [Pseudomonas putida]MDD1967422.1 hypothetical protein [Pseudomonas putida]
MNLTLIVDQTHSYKQAVKIAYEKAIRDGGVDEVTAQECERVLSEPEPDYVYHESKLDGSLRVHEDGCVSFRTLSSRDFYESIKLNSRRVATEQLAVQMDEMWQDLKEKAVDIQPEYLDKAGFLIDEKGDVRPECSGLVSDPEDEKRLFEMLDNHSELRKTAKAYALMVSGLLAYTTEGLSAKYARYFAGS